MVQTVFLETLLVVVLIKRSVKAFLFFFATGGTAHHLLSVFILSSQNVLQFACEMRLSTPSNQNFGFFGSMRDGGERYGQVVNINMQHASIRGHYIDMKCDEGLC